MKQVRATGAPIKCVVDADNAFKFMNSTYYVDENNQDYKIKKPYNKAYDYENISKMSYVYVMMLEDDNKNVLMKVYDETMKKIDFKHEVTFVHVN